jgi:hypothetical protein
LGNEYKARKRGSETSRRAAKDESVAEMMKQAQRHLQVAARLLKDAARLKLQRRRVKRKARR